MINVIIKRLPTECFSYFQWFIYGLYKLEDEGYIKLKFRISIIDRICLLIFNNKWISGSTRRLLQKFRKVPRFNLRGEIHDNKIHKSFVIDSKDSPYVFTIKDLENCNVYFKNQCPIDISENGFEISNGIFIPWQDVNFGYNPPPFSYIKRIVSDKIIFNKNKIFPGMVGPRRMGWSCKRKSLHKEYLSKFPTINKGEKRKKLTAYFGNTTFPKYIVKDGKYDLDWEAYLTAFLEGHTHPNQKREKAVKILNNMGSEYDGRIINDENGHHSDLIIPLNKFSNYLSEFQYNLNISGFRTSIPNRFIESFMSGTAIVTDKLNVKWFLPFDGEVIETIRMGYEKDIDVDWERFKTDISNLPLTDSNVIKKKFFSKWAPEIFAKYVINTTLNA